MKRSVIRCISSSSSDSISSDTDSSLPSKGTFINCINFLRFNFKIISVSQPQPRLVERNPQPNGVCLVNPKRSGKPQSEDIVALAKEIKDVRLFIYAFFMILKSLFFDM